MERGQRIGLILSAIVLAAVAFLILRPDDEDDPAPTSQTTTVEQSPQGEPTATVPAPEPEPEFAVIRIRDGGVQGGEQRITVEKGDVARIEVRADISDEIHLHGYDLYRDVTPDKPARFKLKADIEGVFEIEAHDLGHVIVGTLVVEP
ncbi:MAG TPA: hypothetical protein VD790_08825 [Thermoleophilaceae bacterium]|nr:hypothetical protein [Thermoleophilaceae bacterium]